VLMVTTWPSISLVLPVLLTAFHAHSLFAANAQMDSVCKMVFANQWEEE